MRRRAIAAAAIVGLAWAMLPACVEAGQSGWRADEYQMKAAFLYNFAKFVQWPVSDDNAQPLTMCVFGDDLFGIALRKTVRDKKVDGRGLVVRMFRVEEESRGCHILFISAAEARHTSELLAGASGGAVLTVGETTPFLREGGLVRFYAEGNRLRFQINAEGAQQAGLKISSQLLGIAK